jgi:hypothetical protein
MAGPLAPCPRGAAVVGELGERDGDAPAAAGLGPEHVHTLDRTFEDAVHGAGQAVHEGLAVEAARSLLGVEAAADEDGDDALHEAAVAGVGPHAEGAEQGLAGAVADAAGVAGLGLVAAGGGLVRGEHRGPGLVEVHELLDPPGEVGDAVGVGGDAVELLGQPDHLLGQLRAEGPEDVVLAREVLVERGPGAPGLLGDELDPGLGEAHLGEHLEGGLEDAALRVAAPLAHQGVAPEGGPPDDLAVHREHATHPVAGCSNISVTSSPRGTSACRSRTSSW